MPMAVPIVPIARRCPCEVNDHDVPNRFPVAFLFLRANLKRGLGRDFSGSRRTQSSGFPSSPMTLEWSIPALAQTNPKRCSTMMVPGGCARQNGFPQNELSTRRGSFVTCGQPNSRASFDGVQLSRFTRRFSALRRFLCASTKDIAIFRCDPGYQQGSQEKFQPDRHGVNERNFGKRGNVSARNFNKCEFANGEILADDSVE